MRAELQLAFSLNCTLFLVAFSGLSGSGSACCLSVRPSLWGLIKKYFSLGGLDGRRARSRSSPGAKRGHNSSHAHGHGAQHDAAAGDHGGFESCIAVAFFLLCLKTHRNKLLVVCSKRSVYLHDTTKASSKSGWSRTFFLQKNVVMRESLIGRKSYNNCTVRQRPNGAAATAPKVERYEKRRRVSMTTFVLDRMPRRHAKMKTIRSEDERKKR